MNARPIGPIEAHLRAMRAVLSGPEKWTQRKAARDAYGRPCPISAPEAACWCLFGASWRVVDEGRPVGWYEPLVTVVGTEHFSNWNDRKGRTFAEVADALDRAIELAHEQGR